MKKLRAPKATPLRPLPPSAAVGAAYEKALTDAVDKMAKSVTYWTLAAYRGSGAAMAMDAVPARVIRSAFRRVVRRWTLKYEALAPALAEYFATSAKNRVEGALSSMLREAGFTVRFVMTPPMRNALDATITANVSLIKSIASQYLASVEGAVMRSVARGGDVGQLTKELQETHNVTRRRAAFIARDQNHKATSIMTKARCLELGLDEAAWLHSAGGKEPRPEHVAFSGKRYNVAEGAFLEGKWTWPGMEINCGCTPVPIIPGVDD